MPEILWIGMIMFAVVLALNCLLIIWLRFTDRHARKVLALEWLQEIQDNHDQWILALKDNPEGVAKLSKDEITGDIEYHFGCRARLEFVMRELGKK